MTTLHLESINKKFEDMMRQSNRFIHWFKNRGALTFLATVVVLLWVIAPLLERITLRTPIHALAETDFTRVIWLKEDLSEEILASNGLLYAVPLTWDELAAYDINTGELRWAVKLPASRLGARGMIAYRDLVFVGTSTAIDSYDSKSGKLIWTTTLGEGHVSIDLQIDNDILRIYYGEHIYEIDPITGKIISDNRKDNILWITGDKVIKTLTGCNIEAVSKLTNQLLWTKCSAFKVDEGLEPQILDNNTLIVNTEDSQICSLNLQNGSKNWCNSGRYISKALIDLRSYQAYSIRDDLSLVALDLETGIINSEAKFTTSNLDNEHFVHTVITLDKSVIVAFFSDSRQTFALSIE